MSHVQHKPIDQVGDEGPGLVFIVYPQAIAMMDGSVFWSVIFFLMLITLGLDSTFGGLEAMITALCDEYPRALGRKRELFVLVLLIAIYLCALPTMTYVSISGGCFVILISRPPPFSSHPRADEVGPRNLCRFNLNGNQWAIWGGRNNSIHFDDLNILILFRWCIYSGCPFIWGWPVFFLSFITSNCNTTVDYGRDCFNTILATL